MAEPNTQTKGYFICSWFWFILIKSSQTQGHVYIINVLDKN